MSNTLLENENRMRRFVVLALAAVVMPLSAQWIHYPSAGLPRTPDGKPNLNAPAPRTADGHPDLSGIWDIEHNRPCPPGGCDDMLIGQEFLDIGWGVKGGVPYQPWALDAKKQRAATLYKDDPQTHCMPVGIVRSLTTPLFRKFVQAPGVLLILSERDVNFRQIFTDGRPLPADPQPTWDGYSSGKWDGDTLVIESTGFRDDMWLDRGGSPLTSAGKITERYRRPTVGQLEIQITVDDPKAYTKPFTFTLNHHLLPDTELLNYVCLENEQDVKHFGK
jgi:hypothetical protein